MYLSKVDLDLTKSVVRGDLGDCHRLHQKVMLGFPDRLQTSDNKQNECRKEWQILYRLEGTVLLVQSSIEPNWKRLPEGYTLDRIKELDFQTIETGDLLKFRLLANPVKQRTCDRQDETGQPLPKADGTGKPQQKTLRRLITREEDQIQWLSARLNGAKLEECYVASPGKVKSNSKSSIIRTVQFDGTLRVINPPDFLNVLMQGIGRGRSYGCGLLSIARIF
jgi:CRISPR system Cascade subunit CasE